MTYRTDFLDHATLTQQVLALSHAHPDLVQLEDLGTSPEGRPIWVLTIGPEPGRTRPALMVDANMHANELCGTNVALGFVHDLLRVHAGECPRTLSESEAAVLRELLVYVVPRTSPDGAEAVLTTGAYVRSIPRDDRPASLHPYWRSVDMNGDGMAALMRVEDPTGEYCESPSVAGLLVRRTPTDAGPFYKLYPEGVIENFDGDHVPDPDFLSDNGVDLNRNFPADWAPEPVQAGAGAYPGSEPESAALIAFAEAHPNIVAWVNFHTFGGVFIRPLGDKPDTKLPPRDLAVWRELGSWATEMTGYPMVSGFEEFTYAPDTPIRGGLSEWAYHVRGAVAYVVELWDLFAQVGLPNRGRRFVDRYTHLEREDLEALARWDAAENKGRVMRPWVQGTHPQLGSVEYGGLDPRFGLWNPPHERLAELCEQHSDMLMRLGSLIPRLRMTVTTEPLAGDCWSLSVTVDNLGYLPTWVQDAVRSVPHNEPLWAEVDGEVVGTSRAEIGHLDGWGRGLYSGQEALYFQRSTGTSARKTVRFVCRGPQVTVRVESCRMGVLEQVVTCPS